MSKPATLVNVVRISTKGPGDVSGLLRLIETGEIAPELILAILGKTEGNGGVTISRANMRWRHYARRCRSV